MPLFFKILNIQTSEAVFGVEGNVQSMRAAFINLKLPFYSASYFLLLLSPDPNEEKSCAKEI